MKRDTGLCKYFGTRG